MMTRSCSPARVGRFLLGLLLGAVAATGWAQGVVTGTATYRERIALPPDAVLEVALEELSGDGAAVRVLGTARVEPAGQVPIAFEIPYDPAKTDPGRIYSVHARISAGGELLFATDRLNSVITRGRGTHVSLMLRKASRRGAQPSAPEAPPASALDAPLVNTYWKLTELRGQPVVPAPNQREAHIVLRVGEQSRVGGSGGCNRLTGGYRIEGDAIAFDHLATTRMACPQGMDTEQAFLEALGEARTWKVGGERLELRDAAGAVIARFESRYMK